MEISVSPELEVILGYARDEAMRTGHYGMTADHLILGALRQGGNRLCRALRALGTAPEELKAYIDAQVFREDGIPYVDAHRIGLARGAVNLLNLSVYEALKADCDQPASEHLLLALTRCAGCAAKDFLDARGIGRDSVEEALQNQAKSAKPRRKRELPRAEDIADALEAELKRVMEKDGIKAAIYS